MKELIYGEDIDKNYGQKIEAYTSNDVLSSRVLNRPLESILEDKENDEKISQQVIKSLFGGNGNNLIVKDAYDEFNPEKLSIGTFFGDYKTLALKIPTGIIFSKDSNEENKSCLIVSRRNFSVFERQLAKVFGINLNDYDNNIKVSYNEETEKYKIDYRYLVYDSNIEGTLPKYDTEKCENVFDLVSLFNKYFGSYLIDRADFSLEETLPVYKFLKANNGITETNGEFIETPATLVYLTNKFNPDDKKYEYKSQSGRFAIIKNEITEETNAEGETIEIYEYFKDGLKDDVVPIFDFKIRSEGLGDGNTIDNPTSSGGSKYSIVGAHFSTYNAIRSYYKDGNLVTEAYTNTFLRKLGANDDGGLSFNNLSIGDKDSNSTVKFWLRDFFVHSDKTVIESASGSEITMGIDDDSNEDEGIINISGSTASRIYSFVKEGENKKVVSEVYTCCDGLICAKADETISVNSGENIDITNSNNTICICKGSKTDETDNLISVATSGTSCLNTCDNYTTITNNNTALVCNNNKITICGNNEESITCKNSTVISGGNYTKIEGAYEIGEDEDAVSYSDYKTVDGGKYSFNVTAGDAEELYCCNHTVTTKGNNTETITGNNTTSITGNNTKTICGTSETTVVGCNTIVLCAGDSKTICCGTYDVEVCKGNSSETYRCCHTKLVIGDNTSTVCGCNRETYNNGNSTTIVCGDTKEVISGTYTLTVGAGAGKSTENYCNCHELNICGGNTTNIYGGDTKSIKTGDYSLTVEAGNATEYYKKCHDETVDCDNSLTIKGSNTTSITGNNTTSITGSNTTSITGNNTETITGTHTKETCGVACETFRSGYTMNTTTYVNNSSSSFNVYTGVKSAAFTHFNMTDSSVGMYVCNGGTEYSKVVANTTNGVCVHGSNKLRVDGPCTNSAIADDQTSANLAITTAPTSGYSYITSIKTANSSWGTGSLAGSNNLYFNYGGANKIIFKDDGVINPIGICFNGGAEAGFNGSYSTSYVKNKIQWISSVGGKDGASIFLQEEEGAGRLAFNVIENTSASWTAGDNSLFVWTCNGVIKANMDSRGGMTAYAFTANSARKLKENIVPTTHTNAVDEINKIEIVDYVYKNDESKTPRVGFIADDTDEVFSEDKQHFDINNTVGMLLKAVQELSKENKELRERIEKIEQKL